MSAPTSISSREVILLVGIGGPSSGGKTTLARLLLSVFQNGLRTDRGGEFRSFIIHEDDFYKPDDQIPVAILPSGEEVADWDVVEALDTESLKKALAHVREHGALPPSYQSKEDLNQKTDAGVDENTIMRLRNHVAQKLHSIIGDRKLILSLLEGFLLYASPNDEAHPLHDIDRLIQVPFFLPVTYSLLKKRRESRKGYVTIGPSGSPHTSDTHIENPTQEQRDEAGDGKHAEHFWVDPPGYVDDITWPRYVRDHAWLLAPDAPPDAAEADLVEMVGEGKYIKQDARLLIAPGMGEGNMTEILEWSTEEILKAIEKFGQ
ncbi:ribosylnicotinamide kinase [Ascosphaera pollenicola]|nr:ribosylnicotinamide kinase [Ascosphaera pollenicola]